MLKVGDTVRLKRHRSYGKGRILAVRGDKYDIYFTDKGQQTLKLPDYSKELDVLTGDDTKDDLLENIPPKESKEFSGFSRIYNQFIQKYPGGFNGQSFLDEERDYKVRAFNRIRAQFSPDIINPLLESEDYGKICEMSDKAMIDKKKDDDHNLSNWQERDKLKKALNTDNLKKAYAKNLIALISDTGDFQTSFEKMATFLSEIGLPKWRLLTFFPFIMHPNKYIYVKPEEIQSISNKLGFEIGYKSTPDWNIWIRIMDMTNWLIKRFTEYNCPPHDMIDIQSFFFLAKQQDW